MPNIERQIDPILLKEAACLIEDKFKTPVVILSAELLSEPARRNVVSRILINSPSEKSAPTSVILKQSLPEESDENDQDALARFGEIGLA